MPSARLASATNASLECGKGRPTETDHSASSSAINPGRSRSHPPAPQAAAALATTSGTRFISQGSHRRRRDRRASRPLLPEACPAGTISLPHIDGYARAGSTGGGSGAAVGLRRYRLLRPRPAGQQQTSGYVHVLSALRILAARHAIPADSTVTDLEFGWEICSTNNVPLNFTLTNYAVWTA